MPLFEDFKNTLAQFMSENPTAVIESLNYSLGENEQLEGITPQQLEDRFALLVQSHRNLPGCANAWMVFGLPTPEWTETDPYKLLYNALTHAILNHPKVIIARRPFGNVIGGDQVHATNTGQRLFGGVIRPAAWAERNIFQSGNPPAVSVHSLNAQTSNFTSIGNIVYGVEISPHGANTWTYYETTILMDARAGQTLSCILPGTGSRDYRIVTKGRVGVSRSTVGNYTAPSVTVPTPLVLLDFENATVDGTGNIISIPSIGTDTTPWIPHSNSGVGAAAAMKFATVNGKRVLDITLPSQRLHYAGTLAAVDKSGVLPMFYGSLPSKGFCSAGGRPRRSATCS